MLQKTELCFSIYVAVFMRELAHSFLAEVNLKYYNEEIHFK